MFLQIHVGVFGGHRLLDQTTRILGRLAWWPGTRKDVTDWVGSCMACIRFRKRPTERDAVAVKPLDANGWEEAMVDVEGPSSPADKAGRKSAATCLPVQCLVPGAMQGSDVCGGPKGICKARVQVWDAAFGAQE